jgi:predicted nucleotidyltransferase
MSAQEYLASKRSEIEALCRKYGVVRLRLFGSAVRDDWNEQTSDFDFLAEFTDPPDGLNLFRQFFGFLVDLEDVVGRRVDVVDWKAATKPNFRAIAESEAKEWYAA